MKQSPAPKQGLSQADKNKIILVSIVLVMLLILLGFLFGLILRQSGFQLSILVERLQATRLQAIPTPQCIEPTLTLGATTFHVKSIPSDLSSYPSIPQDTADAAYWLEGTTINYVFAISPTNNNLVLNTTLKTGDPVVINWADCSKDEYVIKSIDTVSPSDLNIFDQTTGGITVYARTDASSLVIRGEHPLIQSAETPSVTDMNSIQLDIQFSDLTPPDNSSVKVGLNITNRGTQAVTLTNNDISLKVENGSEVFPLAVEPALPQNIQPNGTITLSVTFPKPEAASALLKILDTTVDYYFQ